MSDEQVTIQLLIQQHQQSQQNRETLKIEVDSQTTIEQFLEYFRDEEVNKLKIPPIFTQVECDGHPVSVKLRFADLHNSGNINMVIRHGKTPSLKDSTQIGGMPQSKNIFVIPPQSSIPKGYIPPSCQISVQKPSTNQIQPKQNQSIDVVINLVDGVGQNVIILKSKANQTFQSLSKQLLQAYKLHWDNYEPNLQTVKVFCNGSIFNKRSKSFFILNLIKDGKVNFKIERQFYGGTRN